jgi:hypothetical protein
MTRKKKENDVETNGTPVNGTAAAETLPDQAAPDAAPVNRPVFKIGPIPTDKDNSVEAAVWGRLVQTRDGREFTVYSVTVQANWRDSDGTWKKSTSYRGSQIYALVYCLQRASEWILDQRDPQQNIPF